MNNYIFRLLLPPAASLPRLRVLPYAMITFFKGGTVPGLQKLDQNNALWSNFSASRAVPLLKMFFVMFLNRLISRPQEQCTGCEVYAQEPGPRQRRPQERRR